MFKPPKISILLILFSVCLSAQNNSEELFNNFSSHNFLKHNRFFLNPTFSVARENKTSLSFLSRNKFSDFEDSPQLYVGSYSGRVSEKIGVGLGIFQQNFGVFKNFGVLVNYGYQVKLSDKNALAFGFNFMYARSGIDRSKIQVTNPDPFLVNFQERPLINFQPAVNLTLGNFDFGVFLENLVDYDLKEYEFITDFSEKTFSGHIMYTQPFKNGAGMFKDSKLQFLSILKKPGKANTTFTGSILLDLPKFGWIQSTYDDFYGTAIGIGFNISEKISIGFVYENGKNNLGVTNEIGLTYNFGKQEYLKIDENGTADFENTKTLLNKDNPNVVKQKTTNNEDVSIVMDAYKKRQDSINLAQKREADKKFLQLLKIIKSNQQHKSVEVISNRKKDSVSKKPLKKEKKQIDTKISVKKKKVVVKPPKTKSLKNKDLVTDLSGYFIVANYFSSEANAKRFSKTMQNKGFKARYFKHPKKSNYYVYLDAFDTNIDAQQAVASKLNNTYTKLLSIVKVDKGRVGVIPIKKATSTKKVQRNISVKKATPKTTIKKPVKIRKLKSSKGLAPGYYLIVNVFSKKYYANKFVKSLSQKQLNPQFFIYPNNNYRYVYLAKSNSKQEILQLYHSNVDGKYINDKWIMHIE